MESTPAAEFFHMLLRCGVTLQDVLGDLIEQPEIAETYPDEDPAQVVVEMAVGSAELRLRHVPAVDLDRAVELMEMAMDALFADLRAAAEIAARRQRGYRVA
jgi:hypothetical protein